MEWGERSLELAPSSTDDTFASPQTTPNSESIGYSFESGKNSPIDDDEDEEEDDVEDDAHENNDDAHNGNHHQHVGNVVLVPRLDVAYHHTPALSYRDNNHHHHQQQQQQQPLQHYSSLPLPALRNIDGETATSRSGRRRRVLLHLQEEVVAFHPSDMTKRGGGGGFFFRQKTPRAENTTTKNESPLMNAFADNDNAPATSSTAMPLVPTESSVLDRGSIAVAWYDGTPSLELQEHVRRMVTRKLGLRRGGETTKRLHDMRLLDDSVDPPEEIVLSPFLPDGSHFLLKFTTKDERPNDKHPWPESLGSSPSRYSLSSSSSQDLMNKLNATQLALLASASQWNTTNTLPHSSSDVGGKGTHSSASLTTGILKHSSTGAIESNADEDAIETRASLTIPKFQKRQSKAKKDKNTASSKVSVAADITDDATLSMHPDDIIIEARLKKMTELLLLDQRHQYAQTRQDKRQVIFVLANYMGLFVSLIAISAEIQARAPNWLAWLEREFANVQECATDQEALFHCVSNGDFAGLVASVILWLSRSASTKRIFLFGFKSQKQLWTVVYEALVSGLCWGFSYLFIRRALKPEIRKNYFQNHWKDAVYGSMAIFNASFMKQVLKNLIPKERIEEALQQKQLNILSWFSNAIRK